VKSENIEGKNGSFWLPLFVIVLGAFAAILNNSSINVAIPKLMAIFGVATDDIQWVLTAYMLTSALVIPSTGYLGDKYGNKKVFITALSIFTLGSVLCSLSWSCNYLIAFRVLQGIGGGAIMPVSMAIIYRLVPPQKIGMALGIWGMAAVMAPAIGPTFGGYLIDHFNWRLIFLINCPVGIMGIVLSALLLEETPTRQEAVSIMRDSLPVLLAVSLCYWRSAKVLKKAGLLLYRDAFDIVLFLPYLFCLD
jgi:EmrB/QacA subfamily drug resistance transporter